jgi:hypothetical protein
MTAELAEDASRPGYCGALHRCDDVVLMSRRNDSLICLTCCRQLTERRVVTPSLKSSVVEMLSETPSWYLSTRRARWRFFVVVDVVVMS